MDKVLQKRRKLLIEQRDLMDERNKLYNKIRCIRRELNGLDNYLINERD